MDIISDRLKRIKSSPSGAARAIIAELREQGRSVIDLTVGEPDFPTPEHIRRAAHEAAERGETRYTGVQGTVALRKAIREQFLRDYGLDYPIADISVGNGAKQVIFNGLAATINAGDEVIIPAPFWVSYPDMVLLFGGKPVCLQATPESAYKLTAEALEAAITPRTKWLLLNSPCNPTGALYTHDELRALTDVLVRHPHVWLMTDDIYAYLNFTDASTVHPLEVAPELRSRTLMVNGVSKAYAMTGWRIGYGAGPSALITAMAALQSQCTSGASSVSQAAALEALTGPQECVGQFREIFKARRDAAVAGLSKVRGLDVIVPEGAFYVYPTCAALLGKKTPDGTRIDTDVELVDYFLREAGVAMINGTAYGAPGSFRVSYANSLENITQACEAMQAAAARLTD